MRLQFALAPFTVLSLGSIISLATGACSDSSGTASSSFIDGGTTGDGGGMQAPQTAACQGDPTACLSGTVDGSGMAAVATGATVNLYRVFPSGTAMPLVSQQLALDGTWAFSALPAWSHYYVQIKQHYNVGGAQPATIPSITGPLTVPSSGQPLTVRSRPAQLQVFESRGAGGSMQVQWALAHVFDPATGDELMGSAQVSIAVGATTTPMPWGTDLGGNPAYFLRFSTPPAGQPAYTVSATAKELGSAPVTWNLTADPPTFDATIQSPADGAMVAVNKALDVTWAAQPSDFEQVQLFFGANGSGGAWTAAWAAPAPDAQDVTKETVPGGAIAQPGAYLLNVGYAKASCPAMADGCVYASFVAAAQLTAK